MAKAIGTARSTDTNTKGMALRASSGSGMTFTKARGLGASMVADLEGVKAKAKAQYRADRIAAARARRQERQGYSHLGVCLLIQHPLCVRGSAVPPVLGRCPPRP